MRPAIVIAFLLLGACTAEHRAAISYADEQAKAFKDTEASILLRAPCAISVGSYWRVLTTEQRRSVDSLCER